MGKLFSKSAANVNRLCLFFVMLAHVPNEQVDQALGEESMRDDFGEFGFLTFGL